MNVKIVQYNVNHVQTKKIIVNNVYFLIINFYNNLTVIVSLDMFKYIQHTQMEKYKFNVKLQNICRFNVKKV